MGHIRASLQRRKFSISIALKRVFILGRFNEADFAQNVDFVGALTGSWKGFARGGGKVCGEESIDSQFPHVKSVRKKEGKLRGKLFSRATRERILRERWERENLGEKKLEASIGTVKSMCNVIQFTTVRRGRTAELSSFLVRIFFRSENIRLRKRSSVRKKWFRCFPLQEFPRARPFRTQPA